MFRALYLFCCLGVLASPGRAEAQVRLPYASRRLSLSGLGTTVRGDIRTVGMGGASAGLADTFIAAIDNPAGLAMTVGIGDIHFTTFTAQDGHLQSFAEAVSTFSIGVALGLYPWALSVGYLSPYREEGSYALSSSLLRNLDPVRLGVTTRELVLSAGRVLLHDRLSFGLSLTLAQAARSIEAPTHLGGDQSYSSYTAGVTVGVMGQLPRRLLLGLSFSSPLHFGGASAEVQASLSVPGFFQPVEVPWRVSLGLGFVPNRFFRADFTLHLYTQTPETALVRDESARVGERVTLQPRLGAAYVFADYKELKATLFLGGYYEWSRILGVDGRIHGTGGVEARLWIFTIGAGIDIADQYRSYLVSFGVDVFGVMARLGMIPPFGSPPSGRMFPRPWQFSDAGLARPLTTGGHKEGLDPIEVGLGIPRNLGRGLRNVGVELRRIGEDLADAIETTNLTPEQRAAREEAERLRLLEDERADRERLLELHQAELAKQAELTKQAELAKQVEAARHKKPTRKLKRRHPPAKPSRQGADPAQGGAVQRQKMPSTR